MLTIKRVKDELIISDEKKELRWAGTYTQIDVRQLAEEIAEKFPQATSGMILTETEKHLESPKGIVFEDAVQSFRQALGEAWNCPVIFDSEVTTSEAEALEQEKEKMGWLLRYYGYQPGKDEYAAESLLTVGNGFIGLRGTTPEMRISEDHYPATYLAGLYNTAVSEVAGKEIKNEDFVNAPNMQGLTVKIDGEELLFTEEQVGYFERTLDMRTGLFTSTTHFKTASGKEVEVVAKKVVSMADRHLYALSYQVTPLNFSGEIELISEADGGVYNYNVARYRSLTHHHLEVLEIGSEGTKSRLLAQTRQSNILICQQAELKSDAISFEHMTSEQTDTKVRQIIPVAVTKGQSIKVEKIVSVYSEKARAKARSNDTLNSEISSMEANPPAGTFEEITRASSESWAKLWQRAEISLAGDRLSEKMLHLHTYHLLVSGSPVGNHQLDASITARGLHGEAYRGHIFWDELFILPFYIIHFPETARQLLMYRYQRLDTAKQAAKEVGYEGAMYPWQSGLDGTEQSQELHLNPISGEWSEDHSRLQRHVSLAIAYNVWLYTHNTNDHEFMEKYGIELLLEIAKFWLSKTDFNQETGRYSIAGVMGPDEFHEAYPDSQTGGLTDNAYTNMMVVWLFEEIEKIYQTYQPSVLSAIQEKVALTEEQRKQMEQIKHALHLEINSEGIIAQFEGYFDLEEVDWTYYKEKYGNIYRMDRILQAEGRSADEFKVAKQADSLMIFYNLHKTRVDQLLKDMNYQLPEDYLEENLAYYLARTSHGSTLSRIVHAQLASIVGDRSLAWQLYQEALQSDYRDIQGGTTAEGIHAGVMAATLFITLTTFAGIDIRQERIHMQPRLPEQWQELSFKLTIRGIHFSFTVSHTQLIIEASEAVEMTVDDQVIQLVPNKKMEIRLGE
ncbi:glycosyl hydrolase [Enterococcus sp. JM4C]|uniref:glycoside hydrolase family 65 protein n=1 Tax=Candidatus Enterococcus huntleyi TaxID=1857217 RepID=UPI00137A8FE2|nr:glycosyl hydrolase [Enterococcus sp. JM4C]